MTALAAATTPGHRKRDLVPPLPERSLDSLHERAEVGIVRPRIHLRDEQDPH
jgi:hypothetical protein